MARTQDERSLGELFAELSRETGVLVRKEVELATTEMTAKARIAGIHVGTIAAGGALTHAGLLVLLAACVIGLAQLGVTPFLSALIVALATMGIGYALVSKGRANLSRANLVPTHTLTSPEGDRDMADTNTRVSRERIGMRTDEDITGLESPENRVGTYADTEPPAPRTTSSARKSGSMRTVAPESRTREIRAEIEQTREDLSETVNAIQDRLQPSTLASNAVESVKDAARERIGDIADTDAVQYVRANPLPTAMIGIGIAGLAWLAFGRDADNGRSREWNRTRDWRVRPGYEVERDRHLPGDHDAHDDAPGRRRGVVTTEARHLAEQTRRTARRAQTSLRHTWNENPFLIGAVAAVVGALVAASVPATESENRLMGETRDNMIEGVQQVVKDKVEAVQGAATAAVSQVQEAVGLTSGDQS